MNGANDCVGIAVRGKSALVIFVIPYEADNWKIERQKSTDPHLHFYSASRKGLLVRLLLTSLASFLLLVPTILLYELSNLRARLIVIAIFIALFAVAVALLTRARRHEIFASTAA